MSNISFKNDILPLKDELFRLALRITMNREEAEDVVQETMLKVWNKRDTWSEIESIEAYCLTVCRNMALDALRRRDRHPVVEEEPIDTADQSASPLDITQQKDGVSMVQRLINRLPEKQRSCMQLRDIEGKTYKEIAQIMSISEEQVKVNIFRARQAIKQQFKKAEQYGL
ncbi:MAG: RNA polymerase sigma factor [Prevotella sp.]|jgi:RNA polymerase sigma-70 factor (ECF subfamily)|nr:RNA polymerase sigma factor [Prevotella sp.]